MKKFKFVVLSLLTVALLAACGSTAQEEPAGSSPKNQSDKLQVVTSFSILDFVKDVGGDLVEVHSMVPIGIAPHEYEPLPEDTKKATDADIVFYSGLNLEGGKDGWFFRLMDTVQQDDSRVFEVMQGVEPMYLASEDGRDEEINPHAFLSPKVGLVMLDNIIAGLVEVDPDNRATYEANGEATRGKLAALDELYTEKINDLPKEKRILVTSERAYQYMARDYGLQEGYIWELDTGETGSPDQLKRAINFINENKVTALFVESNVDRRPMEAVADATDAEIVDVIYSDELGKPGSDGGTYLDFLQSNIEKIYDGIMNN